LNCHCQECPIYQWKLALALFGDEKFLSTSTWVSIRVAGISQFWYFWKAFERKLWFISRPFGMHIL
jgi:hypothetical protein